MTSPRQSYPLGWPGDYIGDNYDESLKYQLGLTLNGVGIYNVDRNEEQFINLNRVRRLIENILGDVAIRDSFKIVGTGAANDFTVKSGGQRLFVRGFEVLILSDTTYLTQKTDLNDSLAIVSDPPTLNTPSGGDRSDEIYIDIWLGHVTGAEDLPLVPDTVSDSVTNRLRLIAEVKVAEGTTTPGDYVAGDGVPHYTYKLADLSRFDGQAAINTLDVTDRRVEIDKAGFVGNSEGLDKDQFNPSALKIYAQDTPGNTVKISSRSLMTTANGQRIIEVLPQNSPVVPPASLPTKTRFYNAHIGDDGLLDVSSFSEVDTSSADIFVDHFDFNMLQRPKAIIRVDGDGAVTIPQSNILNLPVLGGGGGAGSGLGSAIEEFPVTFPTSQEFFNTTASFGNKDGLNVYRNGERLDKSEFNLPSPNQIQINTPSIPGSAEDETIVIEPRTPATASTNLEDFGVATAGEGPTLKAPNGDIYKLTVDNLGNLQTAGPI